MAEEMPPPQVVPVGRPQQQLSGIEAPHDHDVLSGRGNFVNYHVGNEYFRTLVKKHKVAYVACPKQQKGKFSRIIVDEIRALDPPGRFLKQDPKTKLWEDIGDKKALDKTRQALREGAPELLKELEGGSDEEDGSPQQLDGGVSQSNYLSAIQQQQQQAALRMPASVTDRTPSMSRLEPIHISLPSKVTSSQYGGSYLASTSPQPQQPVVAATIDEGQCITTTVPLKGGDDDDYRSTSLHTAARPALPVDDVQNITTTVPLKGGSGGADDADAGVRTAAAYLSRLPAHHFEPTPINPNRGGGPGVAAVSASAPVSASNQSRAQQLQRANSIESLTFEDIAGSTTGPPSIVSKKKNAAMASSSHMSFSVGDFDESNLSAVFQDSLVIDSIKEEDKERMTGGGGGGGGGGSNVPAKGRPQLVNPGGKATTGTSIGTFNESTMSCTTNDALDFASSALNMSYRYDSKDR